jgi:hypothetical protein
MVRSIRAIILSCLHTIFKLDESIDTFTAYKMYIASKPWVAENYLRVPSRKPDWI